VADKKRRNFEVFSLSFLDCITCGFGAMLLLFVLTVGKSAENKESVVSTIIAMISQLSVDTSKEQELVGNVRYRLKIQDERMASLAATKETKEANITELDQQMALLLLQQSNLEDEIDKLIDTKEAIPTQEETAPIPIPNVQRRQYLSGFNFEGNNIIFLIEATGGMVGYTVDEALENSSLSDEEKRQFPKWQRVIKSVQWILANLTPQQRYQIMVFSADTTALIQDRGLEWFDPLDRETMSEVLQELQEVTPLGGANLERAFTTLLANFPGVDTIMLLTDGLPTQSDSIPIGSAGSSDSDRERLFNVAVRRLPDTLTVNTILYPMSGDPGAAFLFWQLANRTHGALVSPAPSWPDI